VRPYRGQGHIKIFVLASAQNSSAMVRVSMASNTNRGQLKPVISSDLADLTKLMLLAKDKLRLKGVKGFYTAIGVELSDGAALQDGMLILAHRGEDFVGKVIASPERNGTDAEDRPLVDSAPTLFTRTWMPQDAPSISDNRLRILSFNNLAPCLAQGTTDLEGSGDAVDVSSPRAWGVRYAAKPGGGKQLSHNFRCSASALEWEKRLPMLQTELYQHEPDLMCLEEMDATAFPDVRAFLERQGYSSGICSEPKGGANNFVAMFWKVDRLEADGGSEIIYLKAAGTITALMQRFRLLDVSSTETGAPATFVALVTHLKAGIKEMDEQDRAKQIEDLLIILEKYASPDEDVLFAGDFNAHVQDLPFHAAKGQSAKYPPCLQGLAVPRLLRAGFRCAVEEATGSPLAFSQWCNRCDVEIKSTIDHIHCRGSHFKAVAALAAPEDSVVLAAGCLPNTSFPSDHIPVVVDLAICPPWELAAPTIVASDTMPDNLMFMPSDALLGGTPLVGKSEADLLALGHSLPADGRIAITDDGFKYVSLPKDWQKTREELLRAAVNFALADKELLAADRSALEKHLSRRQEGSRFEWGFWSPTSVVGLHVSLGKHADGLNVGKRVRFKIKKLLTFPTRKLGEPSASGGANLFGSRWFTFEVSLIDSVKCDGDEPHISFAVFGAQRLASLVSSTASGGYGSSS